MQDNGQTEMVVKCSYKEMVSIEKLVDNPRNPNKHTQQQIEMIARNMRVLGVRHPIVVSKNSGFINCGHARKLAALHNGWTEFPVDYQEFENEAEEYLNMTADNELAKLAKTDLAQVNVDIQDLGPFDIELLGIPDFTIEPLEKFEPQAEDDSIPDNVETRCKEGDLWSLGNHRLLCGDATNIQHVDRLMAGQKADMVFTDPPYNIETKGGCKGKIGKSLKKQGADIDFISDFNPSDFLNVLPSVFEKNKINAYIFCNKALLPDYLFWAKENNYSFNVLVWKKPNAIPIGDSHRPDIEYLLLFRKTAIWNNGLDGVSYSRLKEYGRENGLHPTMKPIAMIENDLLISSNKGSRVLDLFGGSGSTLIAAEKTNRQCYMMELSPKYCDVILSRWEKYTGKQASLI